MQCSSFASIVAPLSIVTGTKHGRGRIRRHGSDPYAQQPSMHVNLAYSICFRVQPYALDVRVLRKENCVHERVAWDPMGTTNHDQTILQYSIPSSTLTTPVGMASIDVVDSACECVVCINCSWCASLQFVHTLQG